MSNAIQLGAPARGRTVELAPAEHARLAELEAVVERGLQTFVEVGLALTEIRDAKLYRETHATFENYCRERWGFVASRARQLIAAAETVTDVTAAGLPAPVNEAQARELVPLRKEGEQRLVEVWRELVEEFGSDLTAERIRVAVRAAARRASRRRSERPDASRRKLLRQQQADRYYASMKPEWVAARPLRALREAGDALLVSKQRGLYTHEHDRAIGKLLERYIALYCGYFVLYDEYEALR